MRCDVGTLCQGWWHSSSWTIFIVFCFILGSFLVVAMEVGVDLLVSGRLPSDGHFVVHFSFVHGSGVGVDVVDVDVVGYLPLLIWDGVGSGSVGGGVMSSLEVQVQGSEEGK